MTDTINKNEIIKDKDVSVYFDNMQSQYNFNENIAEVIGEDYTHLYIDNGNLSKDMDYSIKPRQKIKVINLLLDEELTNYSRSELLSSDTETVYEQFISEFNVYADKNHENRVSTFLEYCTRYDVKTMRDDYTEIKINGYSQGDSATVLVNKAEALECWGSVDLDEDALIKDFVHYFYDSPLCVRIDIMGTEYISEQFDGQYQEWNDEDNYSQEKFIAELVEYFKDEVSDLEFFEEQLEDLIPYTPKHKF